MTWLSAYSVTNCWQKTKTKQLSVKLEEGNVLNKLQGWTLQLRASNKKSDVRVFSGQEGGCGAAKNKRTSSFQTSWAETSVGLNSFQPTKHINVGCFDNKWPDRFLRLSSPCWSTNHFLSLNDLNLKFRLTSDRHWSRRVLLQHTSAAHQNRNRLWARRLSSCPAVTTRLNRTRRPERECLEDI